MQARLSWSFEKWAKRYDIDRQKFNERLNEMLVYKSLSLSSVLNSLIEIAHFALWQFCLQIENFDYALDRQKTSYRKKVKFKNFYYTKNRQ